MSSAHAEIVAKLPEAFERARASGDLLFFPSTVHTHSEAGVDVSAPFRSFLVAGL